MERLADIVLTAGAGPEIAVVSTKAFTAQLAVLYLLSMSVRNKYQKGRSNIKKLGSVLKEWLNNELSNKL